MIRSILCGHPRLALIGVFILALLVLPFDELLFATAYALFGSAGLVIVLVGLFVLFVVSKRTGWGQAWWGKAYGALRALLR